LSEPAESSSHTTGSLLLANLIVGINACASSMLGIGGGAIMVPLLIILMRVPIKRAIGTSLAVIVLVICVGLAAQIVVRPEDIHWDVALLLTAGSVCGSFMGKWLNKVTNERVLSLLFAGVLVVIAIRLFGLLPEGRPLMGSEPGLADGGSVAFLVVIGLLAGIASSLFGLGGGIVVVPALALGYALFHDKFTATRATSLAMVLPTSLIGAILHWRAGNVDRYMVTRTTPLALVAAVAGVYLAYEVKADQLKLLFGVLMIIAAARLAIHRPSKKTSPENKDFV
jgi:uncharacterized membrane protein YfcA